MIEIGKFNTLTIARDTSVGLFLTDGEHDVLLPIKYIPRRFNIGDELTVFVYLDHEERPVSTTLKPYIQLNDFAYLKVNYINKFGAFLNWGLEKDLFVPFKEQATPMEKDKRYFVYMYMDEMTNRLVATSKTNKLFDNTELTVTENEEVELIIAGKTDLGYNVIINKLHRGLLYQTSVFTELRIGDRMKGFIQKIRPDHKIDVVLQKTGFENIDPTIEKILQELRSNNGYLGLNDNSHPEEIKTVLQLSKKSFKRAIGVLYKQHQIVIEEQGIRLV